MYNWEGKIADEKEFVLIAKTSDKMYTPLKKYVESIHPYGIPCITKITVKPNEKYSEWLSDQIKSK